jgi:tripartite-type tricarboxylate transporter receptor subunit TctC
MHLRSRSTIRPHVEALFKRNDLMKLSLKAGVIALLVAMGLPGSVQAQPASYPQRPITIIAATAPGGPGDTAARLIAEYMTPILGQQVVVENVGGAGGILGAARAARAAPDGYTLLVHQTGITVAPAINSNLTFDIRKDFTTVGLVNTSYFFLVGRNNLPPNNFRELVAWMKGPGHPAKFAHPGVGSLGHLTTLLFAKFAGTDIDAVAYRGIGPAMNDLLGGHVDLLWPGAVAAAPLIKAGKLKGYAFGGKERSKLAPDIPSVVELKAPELVTPFWHALFAPAATPKPIVQKLNAALREALANPQLRKTYEETGVEAFPPNMLTVEASNAFVHSEIERWAAVVNEFQLKQPAR